MESADQREFLTMINKHRVMLVDNIQIQVFIDKMRCCGVLSLEDCQEMLVKSLYPTDKMRASRFLDVIETKGQHGFDVFKMCLDDHYPHLYKTVTGKEPAPRHHISSPRIMSAKPEFGILIQELSDQNDTLHKENSEKTFTIEMLTEERERLQYQLATYVEKLDNYQKVLLKLKKLENDHRELKDELLNIFVRLHDTEKDRDKYKQMSKEKAHKLHENEEKFESAMKLLSNHRSNVERTNSKNERLAQERNCLQKELQHMKMEMETVKRQSTIYFDDIGHQRPNLGNEALIEILTQDKEAALEAHREVLNDLFEANKENDQKDMQLDKLTAENKDLKYMLEVTQKDLAVTERNYQLNWQEMQRVNILHTNALEQRDQAQAEVKSMRQECELSQKRLNEELNNFKKELHGHLERRTSEDRGLLSPAVAGISRRGPFRDSASSGFSSGRGSFMSGEGCDNSDQTSATFPRTMQPAFHSRPSLPPKRGEKRDSEVEPWSRPRTRQILRRGPSKDKLLDNPFPESQIPSSPDVLYNGDDQEEEEEIVTAATITRHMFADRPEHFSDSLLTHKGSEKKDKGHYEKVDLLITQMRKSVKPRGRLESGLEHFADFTLDYDDESEELARIIGKDSPADTQIAQERTVDQKSSTDSAKPPELPKKGSHGNTSSTNLPEPPRKTSTDRSPVLMRQKKQDSRYMTLPKNASPSDMIGDSCVPVRPAKSWHENQEKSPLSRKRLAGRRSIPEGELGAQIRGVQFCPQQAIANS